MAHVIIASDGSKYQIDPPNVYHLVVPNANGLEVLTDVSGQDSFRLPTVVARKNLSDSPWLNSWNSETDDLCEFIERRFLTKVYVRRLLWYDEHINKDTLAHNVTALLAVDILKTSDTVQPPQTRWRPFQEVFNKRWEVIHEKCDMRSILNTFFAEEYAECKQNLPVLNRAPWRTRGWLQIHLKWVRTALESHGIELKRDSRGQDSFAQIRNMHRSSVLRCIAHHKDGQLVRLYSKTSLAMYAEGSITRSISDALPEVLPPVIEHSRNSFIQREAAEISGYPEPHNLMHTLAEMHTSSIEHVPQFAKEKLPVRNISWIRDNLQASILRHNALKSICHSKMKEFLGKTEKLRQLCSFVDRFKIPDCLVHGDLDVSNMYEHVRRQDRYVFIDWSYASISNPFFDYIYVAFYNEEAVSDSSARAVYIDRWIEFMKCKNISWEVRRENFDGIVNALKPLFILLHLYSSCELHEAIENRYERLEISREITQIVQHLLQELNK